MKSYKDLIFRFQPLPAELKKICEINKGFANAFKLYHPDRFIPLRFVIISYPPGLEDEVIGLYVFDYGVNPPKLKQDFVVDEGRLKQKFIIYTSFPNSGNKSIRHINEFFRKYPSYSREDHYPKVENLAPEFQEAAKDALEIIENIKKLGFRELISDQEYQSAVKLLEEHGF